MHLKRDQYHVPLVHLVHTLDQVNLHAQLVMRVNILLLPVQLHVLCAHLVLIVSQEVVLAQAVRSVL